MIHYIREEPVRFWSALTGLVAAVIALVHDVIFVVGLIATMFIVWFERKIVSGLQNRVGPNKAGPWGMLQTLADGLKLITKEDLMPGGADGLLFKIAPYISFSASIASARSRRRPPPTSPSRSREPGSPIPSVAWCGSATTTRR